MISLTNRKGISGNFVRRIVLVLGLFVSVQLNYAQVAGGTIQGTVSDDTGAMIPNAKITITRKATGVTRTVETNTDGFFSAPNLTSGLYNTTISAVGFSSVVRNDIPLAVGAVVVLNTTVHVGKATESVQVNDAPPAIDLATSSVSGVVNGAAVRDLPLNGRDWASLATLEPGVSKVETQPLAAAGQTTRLNRGMGTNLTVSGTRPQQNNYRVDGISANDYANSAPGSVLGTNLGVDGIQEFSVITSNAPAAYGKSSGAVVNAITRSGTNAFHGSAYEFFRNSALDAKNFFDGSEIPPFRQNQFGASGGVPIVKGRTFVFANYEGVRQFLGVTNTVFTPTAAARTGQLAAGNVTVDPNVAPYLALWPLPNGPINGDTGQFISVSNQVSDENYFTTRIDHTISATDFLHGTYLIDRSQQEAPDNLSNVLLGTIVNRQLVSLEESHAFSPSFLNSVRFGFTRTVADAPRTLKVLNPLVTDTSLGFFPGAAPGQIVVSGLEQFNGGPGGIGEFIWHYNSFQVYDDASITRGKHSLQIGGSVERDQSNDLASSRTLGRFQFGSLKNFLTNKPTSFNSNVTPSEIERGWRQSIVGAYLQDDWHLRPNFTLNLGLRYEMATVPTEVNGLLSTLVNITDPTPRIGPPYFQNPTLRNFEPRVGFSWDPFANGKTSIRGAFGIYDVLPLEYLFEITFLQSAPFHLEGLNTALPVGAFPSGGFPLSRFKQAHVEQNPGRSYVEQWTFNVQRELARTLTAFVGYVGSHGVHSPFSVPDANIVFPTLTPQGYVWPTPAGSGTIINPNPDIGTIVDVSFGGSSSYNGLQAKLAKTMSRGLQIQGAYTWSKSIDTSSSGVNGNTFDNSVSELPFFDHRLTRTISDFDVRHNLAVSYLWHLPSMPALGVAGWPIRGWTWSGIFRARSGVPFTPTIGGDPLGLKNAQTFDFPDRLTGPGCESAVRPGSLNYVKTQCFAFPNPTTRLGNSGRNSLTGPGLVDYDIALMKDNPIKKISERFDVQFQVQFFNVLNHVNLAPPLAKAGATNLFNANGNLLSSGGVITSTVDTSRQIQFSSKVIW